MAPLPDRARVALDSLRRDQRLTVVDVLRQTDKSLLAAGTLAGQAVVAKVLLDDDPFWTEKLGHEIAVYRAFSHHTPPVRVPRLIHADDARLLILEHVDGHPLDPDRYPAGILPDTAVDATLTAVTALHRWEPPIGTFHPIFNYAERIDRYRNHGFLNEADAAALRRLLATWSDRWEINHGDPLPSNVLLTPDGEAALLDWEFTGLYLPGFDLALLHTLLVGTPHAQHRIEHLVMDQNLTVPFTINLAIVLTREMRTHRELPDETLRTKRLSLIDKLWVNARERLHTVASGSA